VDLTYSHATALPDFVRKRYTVAETRNAAAIFAATSPVLFEDFCAAMNEFELLSSDLVDAGGSESSLAKRLNGSFRSRGWREARVDTDIELKLRIMPYAPQGEKAAVVTSTRVSNEGYKVDNFKDRVALDLEWNAKDGNLDRDLGAYRALYDAGLIDLAVLVTRTTTDLRTLGAQLRRDAGMSEEEAIKVLGTSTTTNLDKLLPRMTRGDAGGCPLLAVAINGSTWEGATRT
jgi:hypothetical protein